MQNLHYNDIQIGGRRRRYKLMMTLSSIQPFHCKDTRILGGHWRYSTYKVCQVYIRKVYKLWEDVGVTNAECLYRVYKVYTTKVGAVQAGQRRLSLTLTNQVCTPQKPEISHESPKSSLRKPEILPTIARNPPHERPKSLLTPEILPAKARNPPNENPKSP